MRSIKNRLREPEIRIPDRFQVTKEENKTHTRYKDQKTNEARDYGKTKN